MGAVIARDESVFGDSRKDWKVERMLISDLERKTRTGHHLLD